MHRYKFDIESTCDQRRFASGRYGIDIKSYRVDMGSIYIDTASILDQHRVVSGLYGIDIESHRVDMGSTYVDIGSM